MGLEAADAIHILYKARSARVVLGLTGRTGSGCSTAAEILAKTIDVIELPKIEGDLTVQTRKDRIVRSYFEANWQPYFVVSVTPIIASFILEQDGAFFAKFLESRKLTAETAAGIEKIVSAIDDLRARVRTTIDTVAARRATNDQTSLVDYLKRDLKDFARLIKTELGKQYTKAFQEIADHCRRFGNLVGETPDVTHVFSIVKRLDYFIGEIGNPRVSTAPAFFVLDAIRNPFEAQWLKENIPGFFLVAVNTPDKDRKARLHELELDRKTIAEFDEREYPKTRKKVPSGLDAWISQDIQSCIERADIHLTNPGLREQGIVTNLVKLTKQLVRYACLIQHPGLVTPSREERSMQAAYVARVNSGCISRQVGAVVTDINGSTLAVGWNDVPFGHVPCLLRNRDDLFTKQDDAAFSDYERQNEEFRKHYIKDLAISAADKVALAGRSTPFCFRDTYNVFKDGQKNQVHTRSLHAEENAFLQLVKHGIRLTEGAVLYSTASPCELCSKKAFQLGVGEIVYVDPYPGISLEQILSSGVAARRPTVRLFSGAIGAAYHRLYEPLMSFKDEIAALCSGGPAGISQTITSPKSRAKGAAKVPVKQSNEQLDLGQSE